MAVGYRATSRGRGAFAQKTRSHKPEAPARELPSLALRACGFSFRAEHISGILSAGQHDLEARILAYLDWQATRPALRAPEELDRLDSKNWTLTPDEVQDRLIASVNSLAEFVDAFILMDQVDMAETGVSRPGCETQSGPSRSDGLTC